MIAILDNYMDGEAVMALFGMVSGVDTLKGILPKLGQRNTTFGLLHVLATVLMTYKTHPSMKDCEAVAKSLVMKYSFLKEHVSEISHFLFCKYVIYVF